MTDDPFAVLGLAPDATTADVAAARRRLAKRLHPDAGGDGVQMQRLNDAAQRAERLINEQAVSNSVADGKPPPTSPPMPPPTGTPRGSDRETRPTSSSATEWDGVLVDEPSFTVEALPAQTFEALLAVAPSLGTVVDEDPPYLLVVDLAGVRVVDGAVVGAGIRVVLNIVPDAGASTVSLAVLRPRGSVVPQIESIRDLWVAALNELDWSSLDS